MFFSKSITFDDEDLRGVAVAAQVSSAFGQAEQEYLERLRAGVGQAFDNLVTRYSGELYAFLCRSTGDPEEAADLTQETFICALKSVKNFRGDSELKTWLFRIAVNQSRNRFRWWNRHKRDVTVSLDASVGDSDARVSDTIADGSVGPEDGFIRAEREQAIVQALRSLPDAYRETIILCDVEGLTYEEIATVLSINIGTVKSRIARGREELRKRLSDF